MNPIFISSIKFCHLFNPFLLSLTMHRVLFITFAAFAAASPAGQGIDFAAINAAPSPSLTGPPVTANTQTVSYNTASINAQGSAAATGIASASAIASQAPHSNSKRNIWGGWSWPWAWNPAPSSSTSYTSTTTQSQPWGGMPTTSASSKPYAPPTTTSQVYTSGTSTTSSSTSCPTVPEAGTYCGFINPEDPCAVQPDGSSFLRQTPGSTNTS